MDEREVVQSGKMSRDLISGFLVFGILGGLIYNLIFSTLLNNILGNSLVLLSICAIILQGIIAILLWKASTLSAFKKRTINSDDVSKVIKNLVIFTVILCIIATIINYSNLQKSINKELNSNVSLKMSDGFSKYYSAEKKAEYEKQKLEAIETAKSQVYTYFTIIEIGIFVAFLGVLPLEKRFILKKLNA